MPTPRIGQEPAPGYRLPLYTRAGEASIWFFAFSGLLQCRGQTSTGSSATHIQAELGWLQPRATAWRGGTREVTPCSSLYRVLLSLQQPGHLRRPDRRWVDGTASGLSTIEPVVGRQYSMLEADHSRRQVRRRITIRFLYHQHVSAQVRSALPDRRCDLVGTPTSDSRSSMDNSGCNGSSASAFCSAASHLVIRSSAGIF